MSDTVKVEYVGLKDQETDHLYGTGIVWTGKGDVQEVPAAAWARMKVHVDVWREADEQPAAEPQASEPQKRGPGRPRKDAA